MSRIRFTMISAAVVASPFFLFACGSDSPMAPELDEVDPATVRFLSHFNEENQGAGLRNWSGFAEWDVVSGCADLHGNGFVDIWPNNGLYVDLDGTCMQGALLQSREPVTLPEGNYVLEFWLAGNNRINAPDTVIVSLGALHQEQIVMQRRDPFHHYKREIAVGAETSEFLSFENLGGDDYGLLLDLVRIRELGPDEIL